MLFRSAKTRSTRHLSASGYIANHFVFSKAPCTGNIGYVPDPDGVLRRLPTLTTFRSHDYLGLADAMLRCSTAPNSGEAVMTEPAFYARETWRIPYHRSQSAYTVVSAADVLQGRLPVELIKGQYVLVGSSYISLSDRVSTPLAPIDRKSTRLNSSHSQQSRMPSSA